jgi:hypothetical protein
VNYTYFDNLLLLSPPRCQGFSLEVIRWLLHLYPNRAARVPPGSSMDDFLLLMNAPKFVEDVSSYSYWAGIFSNSTEKHVRLDYHGVCPENAGYVYHDVKKHRYFLTPGGRPRDRTEFQKQSAEGGGEDGPLLIIGQKGSETQSENSLLNHSHPVVHHKGHIHPHHRNHTHSLSIPPRGISDRSP